VKNVVHMVPGSAFEQTRADGSVGFNAQRSTWFHGVDPMAEATGPDGLTIRQ